MKKNCNCIVCRFERKELDTLEYVQGLGKLMFVAVKDRCLTNVEEGKMQAATAKAIIDYLEKTCGEEK